MKKFFVSLLLVLGTVLLVSCGKTVAPEDEKYFPITVRRGRTVEEPEELPEREGYVYKGYYTTRRGHTWLEENPVEFPYKAEKNMTLYAYFEPVNSVTANHSPEETYVSSITSDSRLIFNPLEYRWNHEDSYVDMMVTSLYATEVDWDLAIEDGVADFPGDFSKIVAGDYSIEAFDYKYILVGATEYPVNEEGESAVDEDGNYDRDLARDILGTEWTYKIREDLVFEDGTPITSATFEYTLKNWLDPVQNNYRANMWYRTEENENGRPILNAYEYFEGEADWEDVGFEIVDDYTFKLITFDTVSQVDAVGMGNGLRLIHPEKYAASIDQASGQSQYGTPDHKYMSYGPYVIKSWDENQKIVFNKNYDYVLKGTINYKSQVVEIVDDVHAAYQLFIADKLSVLGLTKDYYAEFAEDPRVKDSWGNFPQYIIVNLRDSRLGEDGHKPSEILFDKRFRQALFFGFDRNYFAHSVYAPNKPTLMPIPNNSKHYLYDTSEYTESQPHLDLLDEVGLDLEDYGYNPEKAKELFDAAYADWLADDNTGPVTLKYISDQDEFSISIDNFLKDSLEKLFEDENGEKRLIIDVQNLTSAGLEQATENADFDLTLTSVGFGHAQNAYWQYIVIAMLPALLGGASELGLNFPYTGDGTQMDPVVNTEIEVDFRNTYEFLTAMEEEELNAGQAEFLEMLDEDGWYIGSFLDMAIYMIGTNPAVNLFWSSPEEPFDGASEDLDNLTAAVERIFLDYVPLIPTVTRSSSTLYGDSVTIEWPEYSDTFGWGAARYRYLNTDRDFYQD